MKDLKLKINRLKELSAIPTTWGNGDDLKLNLNDKMDQQDKLMEELTAMARKNNTLLGRNIRFSVADGDAVYIIDKVNEKSVHLTWIDYIDGYCDRHYGERGGSMKIQEALGYTKFEDQFIRIVS